MSQKENEVRLERLGPLTLLDIRGYVTRKSRPLMEETYQQINPEKEKKILLRFDENTYFNSEGIKVMIDFLAKASKNHQEVGITGLSKHFKKIFHMVGITKWATIFETVKGALRELGGER